MIRSGQPSGQWCGRLAYALLALLALAAAPLAQAQGTAFTYQGRLSDAGAPANGSYDLEFRLYAAETGGLPVAPTLTLDNVAVAGGLFSVKLDFGAGVLTGAARWLGIAVRPGSSSGLFTTLVPRHELTPSPGAVFSGTAGSVAWAGVTGKPAGFGDGVDNDSGGTVTSVTAGSGLSGGTITGSGTLAIATGGVTSGMISSGAVGSAQINQAQVQTRISGSCPAGMSIKTVNADGTTVCELLDAKPGFARSTLDATGVVGLHTSLVIGTDGLGLISYYDQTNSRLKIAHCSNTACTTATTATIDSAPGAGNSGTSIAIGADGLGLVTYFAQTNILKVAHCNDLTCSSVTIAALTVLTGSGSVSNRSLVIGSDGLGILSYYDSASQALKAAHCGNTACSTATHVTVDGNIGVVGAYHSMAIGADGLPVISYVTEDTCEFFGTRQDDRLKVAHCNDVSCGSTTVQELEGDCNFTSPNLSEGPTSITIGGNGFPIVTYSSESDGDQDLRVALCQDLLCSSSTTANVGATAPLALDTSITIGSDGLGLIASYAATTGDLDVTHCSNTACSAATTSRLDSPGDVGRYTSIAIGTDGLGLVSYHDATNGDLKVAHCSNAQCIPYVDRAPAPPVGLTSLTAGAGLSGGTLTSTGTLAVAFGGSGASTNVARSDHHHDSSYWKLTGNAGTTPGTNFLGTTDNQALELKVNGQRALRLETNGSAVFRDSQAAAFDSTGVNQFLVRAAGGVGINTNQPAGLLDLSFGGGAHRVQFRQDGAVPGVNLTGTGGNLGVLRLRRKLEIWPNDAATAAGVLDLRNTAGAATITLDGAAGTSSFAGNASFGASASFAGDVFVDVGDLNDGTTATPWLTFGGTGSGEGIRGPRSAGHVNQYGLEFVTSSQTRLAIKLNGNVGIGTNNPSFQLQLSSDSAAKPTSGSWTVSSDARLKKDVRPLDGALDKLLRLRGVRYRWIDPAAQGGMDGTYMGLIAQEVEPVIPEWVATGADGFKTVTVSGFEGLTAEAVRELRAEKDAQIAAQRERLEALGVELQRKTVEIGALRERLDRLEALLAGVDRPLVP